jgi:sterol desaturase/sphingolipid hydroxylase (fatty acid hydroxylase superfamily)
MESEIGLRLGFFLTMLTILSLAERLFPRREIKTPKTKRRIVNLLLIFIDSIAVRVFVPFTAASVAVYSEGSQIGLLHHISFPSAFSIVISVIILDFIIYAQHVIFHHIPILWLAHKVHHIDREMDVTTGVRFHPFEIILSVIIKSITVLLLGIPFAAVVIFEIILTTSSLFNHSNIKLPLAFDKFLRFFIVTPDMHRIHHSIIEKEACHNFGFNLPWWDRIFRTYKEQPLKGHLKMDIGLKEYNNSQVSGLLELLLIPFINKRKLK